MKRGLDGRRLALILLVTVTFLNFTGFIFDLYRQLWWFDRALHPATIFAITFAVAVFLSGQTLDPTWPIPAISVLTSVGIAIGALWEVAEWGFDQLYPSDIIKGKYDTVIDLIMDFIGSFLAATVWFIKERARRSAVP
jgi:hypothetical protein